MFQDKNNKNKLLLGVGLAGIVLTGVSGYLYFSKKQNNKNPSTMQLNNLLEKQYFKTPSSQLIPQNRKINQFTQKQIQEILFKYTSQTSLEKALPENIQKDFKTPPICRKDMPKQTEQYYCLDCCIACEDRIQNNLPLVTWPNNYRYQLCTDCFDHEQHKGHNYIKKVIEGESGCCDCGNLAMVLGQGCCKKHPGIKQEQWVKSYASIQPEMATELVDLFSNYLSIIIQKSEIILSLDPKNQEKQNVHINSLINNFVKHAEEIISQNQIFAHLFSKVFLKRQSKNDIFYHSCQNRKEAVFSKQNKNSDCQCSNLTNILRFTPLFNEQASKLLGELIFKMYFANRDFAIHFTSETYKLLKIIFPVNPDKQFQLPQYFTLLYFSISDNDVYLPTIDEIGAEITNPLDVLIDIWEFIEINDEVNWQVCIQQFINLISIIISQFKQNLKTIQKILQFPQVVDKFLDLAFMVEQKVLNKEYEVSELIDKYDRKLIRIFIQKYSEQAIRTALRRIFTDLKRLDDQNLINLISQICVDKYQINFYQLFKDIQNKTLLNETRDIVVLNSVYMTLPIELAMLNLSELPNKVNLTTIWTKLFNLEKNSQKFYDFINNIMIYQQHHINFHPTGIKFIQFYLKLLCQQNGDIGMKNSIEQLIEMGQNSEYLEYDMILFSSQVMNAYFNHSCIIKNIHDGIFQLPRSERNPNILQFLFAQIYINRDQILLDSSAFVNLYASEPETWIKDKKQVDQIKQEIQQQLKKMLITLMQLLPQEGAPFRDIKNATQQYINEFAPLDHEFLLTFTNFDEKNQFYSLKQEFHNHFYVFNLQRSKKFTDQQDDSFIKKILDLEQQQQKTKNFSISKYSGNEMNSQYSPVKLVKDLQFATIITRKLYKSNGEIISQKIKQLQEEQIRHYVTQILISDQSYFLILDMINTYFVKNTELFDELEKENKLIFIDMYEMYIQNREKNDSFFLNHFLNTDLQEHQNHYEVFEFKKILETLKNVDLNEFIEKSD